MHVPPLTTLEVEFRFAELLRWAKQADKLLSKYRLALEEIAAFGNDDGPAAASIARDALKE